MRAPTRLAATVAVLSATLLMSGCTPGPRPTPSTTATANGATFENPIIGSGADPWVIRSGARYYSIQA